MFKFVEDHLAWRARALLQHRYDDLARHYALPLPVRLGRYATRVETVDDLILHFRRHAIGLEMRGVTALLPHVVALGLPVTQQRVWVTWHGYDRDWTALTSADAVYGFDWSGKTPLITEIEFRTLMMPEFGRRDTHRRLTGHKPPPPRRSQG